MAIFFENNIAAAGQVQVLSEESSKHIVQVLRMGIGDTLELANGKGVLADVEITNDHKKKCEVRVGKVNEFPRPALQHTIAISLLKNSSRFEWFLEKAAELGISKIIPLICQRTEKQHFRFDRMQAILVSAMLQSQQSWLTELSQPVSFNEFLAKHDGPGFIAHCEPGRKASLLGYNTTLKQSILIGPEGDFSPDEIGLALNAGFVAITLGTTRLRTETAGIVAATLAQIPSCEGGEAVEDGRGGC